MGFTISETAVEGPGAKASIIIGEDGEIIGFNLMWREVAPSEDISVINPSDALIEFKDRWPNESKPEELEQADLITEINISEVYVAYYTEPGSIPQTYIEPVYIFKGYYEP